MKYAVYANMSDGQDRRMTRPVDREESAYAHRDAMISTAKEHGLEIVPLEVKPLEDFEANLEINLDDIKEKLQYFQQHLGDSINNLEFDGLDVNTLSDISNEIQDYNDALQRDINKLLFIIEREYGE